MMGREREREEVNTEASRGCDTSLPLNAGGQKDTLLRRRVRRRDLIRAAHDALRN